MWACGKFSKVLGYTKQPSKVRVGSTSLTLAPLPFTSPFLCILVPGETYSLFLFPPKFWPLAWFLSSVGPVSWPGRGRWVWDSLLQGALRWTLLSPAWRPKTLGLGGPGSDKV